MRNYFCRHVLFLLTCLLSVTSSFAQDRVITGRISDEKGFPAVGATIRVKETNDATTTDKDGNYRISVPASGRTLVLSFVGAPTQEFVIDGRSVIDASLGLSGSTLSDVVVVGYGTVRKRDLTGAVGSVKGDQLTQIATPDVVQAMQGRVAGVQVISNSGEPGSGATIRIRGIGSINGSSPIYVVDGYQTGDISFLAPSDIESIDILKDASATAIYGSRGANGVIVVTTKKGRRGGVKVSFDSYVGNQKAWRTVPMANATEYANLVLQGYDNDGTPLNQSSMLYTRLDFVRQNNYVGTNWQNEVMQSGFMQNHSLNVSGGNDLSRFRLSGTYFTQDGIVRNSAMKKYFINFSNDFTISKWLTAGISGAFTHFEKNYYNADYYSGVLTTALGADPITPAWDKNTNNWGRADISYQINPARSVDELKNNKGYGNYLVANAWTEAKIMKGLTFKSQIGTTLNVGHNKSYAPEFFIAVDEARDLSSLWERRSQWNSVMWSNYLNYTRSFGKHTASAMAGAEIQKGRYNEMSAVAYDVPADKDLMFLSSSQSTDYQVYSGQNETALQSYFGRLNYSYDGKYLLTATLRYDGSSKFLGENRWGVFPSFAGAWVVSEESFMKNASPISLLKLRGGWGRVGNEQSAGSYDYTTSVYGNNIYVFNDQITQGFAPGSLANPELKWEVNAQSNFGIDLGLFNNRLTFSADYFDRKTEDMIVSVPIPGYVGTGAPRVNAGSMRNFGYEFTAGYNGGNEFRYNLSANITFINNELTSLGGGAPQDGGGSGKLGSTTRVEIGQPFPYFYGLKTDGIFNSQAELDEYKNKAGTAIQPNAKPGDVKFLDTNDDGKIDDQDRMKLGSPYAKFQYGFNADLSYKGFDLRLFIQGLQGNSVVNGMHWTTRNGSNAGGGWSNFEKIRLQSWTAATPDLNQPRMTATDPNNNMRFSDRYIQDGSYLRLKNIQLGYTLPRSILDKAKISSLRIYLSADNLLTVTDYEGFDPEIGGLGGYSYGLDVGTYPQPRTLRAGVTINF